MSSVDDLLFAPIGGDTDDDKTIKQRDIYLVSKLLDPDLMVDVSGYQVRLGSSHGVLYFKLGDDIQIGPQKYIVIVAGDYDTAIVEPV